MKSEVKFVVWSFLEKCVEKSLYFVLIFFIVGVSNGLIVKDFMEMGRDLFSVIEI